MFEWCDPGCKGWQLKDVTSSMVETTNTYTQDALGSRHTKSNQTKPINQTKPKKKHTKSTRPNLFNQTYQTKPTKTNLPQRTNQIKHRKPNLGILAQGNVFWKDLNSCVIVGTLLGLTDLILGAKNSENILCEIVFSPHHHCAVLSPCLSLDSNFTGLIFSIWNPTGISETPQCFPLEV